MSDRINLDIARKGWATLVASFALRGFALSRLRGGGYYVAKWDQMVDVPDLRSLFAFAEKAGIDLPREAPP